MDVTHIIKTVHTAVQSVFGERRAEFGCVLGSGLGDVANLMTDVMTLSYSDIPFLQSSTVQGHAGQMSIGRLHGAYLVCMQGRPHWYEGVSSESFIAFVAAMTALGVSNVIVTNAVGGIHADFRVGDVVMMTDHINMQFKNPLIGIAPPAFISMDAVYDSEYRAQLNKIASDNDLPLKEGVYCGVLGPSFETPAEIRAFKNMGADLVAMSVIPEVTVARYFNCRVLGLSVVSNPAAGLSEQTLSHDVTLQGVAQGKQNLEQLLHAFLQLQQCSGRDEAQCVAQSNVV